MAQMKSILPADLEAKRIAIAKTHNKLVILLLLAMFSFLSAVVFTVRRLPGLSRHGIFGALLLCGAGEAYALYRIFKYDEELCKRYDFLCPNCHKPLYEPRAFVNLTGRCPKYGQSFLPPQ